MMTSPSRRRLPTIAVATLLALVGGLSGAGCYGPSIQDGTLSCASGDRCPHGFTCRTEVHLCYRKAADAAAAETMLDSGTDAGAERASDSGQERGPDASPDTAPDVAPDVAPDMAPDMAPDIAPDMAPDVAPDSGGGARGLGSSCDADSQCASGACADGVCCQSACTGRCEACNLQGSPGSCLAVAAGLASPNGHPACPTDPVETCMRDGTCDGNRGCRLRRAGTACGSASCSGGTTTPAPKCDGLGACQPSVPRACAPYACNGNVGCFDSGTTPSQCQAPNACVSGSCGLKSNGAGCAQSSECASNHCVDAVCCNETCTEKCKACDVGTSPGTCTQVTSGPPHGARSPCAGSGSGGTCGGSCSAASPTDCTYPGSDVTCLPASCSGATFTARTGCTGAGSCATAAPMSCGDFTCNAGGTSCLSACTADNQCASAARPYCDGGACVSGRSNGARCGSAGECASHQCVDGFCCNGACQLPCQACDVANHAGTCWPVANGAPYGGRAACGGAGDCAGYCNNLSSGQCFYPDSRTSCACPNGVVNGTCNSMGHCQTVATICL